MVTDQPHQSIGCIVRQLRVNLVKRPTELFRSGHWLRDGESLIASCCCSLDALDVPANPPKIAQRLLPTIGNVDAHIPRVRLTKQRALCSSHDLPLPFSLCLPCRLDPSQPPGLQISNTTCNPVTLNLSQLRTESKRRRRLRAHWKEHIWKSCSHQAQRSRDPVPIRPGR